MCVFPIALQGDTLENVANELDCILATGFYQFSLSNAKGSQIALVYEPSLSQAAPALQQQQQLQQQQAPPQATPGAATPTAPGARHLQLQYPQIVREVSQVDEAAGVVRGGTEKWSREQINDFVRKLGFLDSEAEGGEKIKRFIHLNEVCVSTVVLGLQVRMCSLHWGGWGGLQLDHQQTAEAVHCTPGGGAPRLLQPDSG